MISFTITISLAAAAGVQFCNCPCGRRRACCRPGGGPSQRSSSAHGRPRSGRRSVTPASVSLETTTDSLETTAAALETTTGSPPRSPSQSASPVLGAGSARRQPLPAATPAVSPIRSHSQSPSSTPVLLGAVNARRQPSPSAVSPAPNMCINHFCDRLVSSHLSIA